MAKNSKKFDEFSDEDEMEEKESGLIENKENDEDNVLNPEEDLDSFEKLKEKEQAENDRPWDDEEEII